MAEPTPNALYRRWLSLTRWPGGRLLFSLALGWMAPYTGSIRPRVVALEPGFARVEMRDRRAVRNPFRSVHAIALMNLAEAASGLAMLSGLPEDARAIITKLSIRYEKKARGRLAAEARVEVPPTRERAEHVFESIVTNAAGEVVARAEATWLVGPR